VTTHGTSCHSSGSDIASRRAFGEAQLDSLMKFAAVFDAPYANLTFRRAEQLSRADASAGFTADEFEA
jgi:hypothetical protein